MGNAIANFIGASVHDLDQTNQFIYFPIPHTVQMKSNANKLIQMHLAGHQ